MKYVVNVSGGLTSFEALRRTIERYGVAHTTALFADTKIEDEDLYRFLDDQERLLGITIERIAEGRTPFQVLRDERCITMQAAVPCSKILKRRLLDKLIAERFKDTKYTRVFGMDWSEPHRMERLRERLAPIPVWFPLAEQPYVMKSDIKRWLQDHGVAVPRLYTLGFDHNNCGGGCVKAGQAHWAHLLKVMPERYAVWESWEQSMRKDLEKDISIMRRQGATLTLERFRHEREAGMKYERDLWGGCGCFVDGREQ